MSETTPTGAERRQQKEQAFRDLIDRAAFGKQNPYEAHLAWVYAYGILRELLVYSAENQMEVHEHLRRLEQGQVKARKRQRRAGL